MQAFYVDVKEGWSSLFIGEWFTLKCFKGDGVVFRGMASLPIPPQLEYSI